MKSVFLAVAISFSAISVVGQDEDTPDTKDDAPVSAETEDFLEGLIDRTSQLLRLVRANPARLQEGPASELSLKIKKINEDLESTVFELPSCSEMGIEECEEEGLRCIADKFESESCIE